MVENKPSRSIWSTVKPFANGGLAGMCATCIIQPVDIVKVRIQLGQGGATEVAGKIMETEGIKGFYKGLSAGLLRQITYTTTRLGTFQVLSKAAQERNEGRPLPLYQKALCGLTAGAVGAGIGSPADLALLRMQADSMAAPQDRRNYKNVFDALKKIVAEEGVLGLWKGGGPTLARAMALNMGMMASYDQSTEYFQNNLGLSKPATVVAASAVSGFFASVFSLPCDYIKSQVQRMKPDASGKLPYSGTVDCALKTLASGGPFRFYAGFPTYVFRIGPHVMFTWIFMEQIKRLESRAGL